MDKSTVNNVSDQYSVKEEESFLGERYKEFRYTLVDFCVKYLETSLLISPLSTM